MHRCHVPGAAPGTTTLTGDEAHHIQHVLRLGPGDALRVFDGRGREWAAHVISSSRADGVTICVDTPVTVIPEERVALTLAIGLLKGDQMSGVIRDATALGVARIIPVLSTFTVARTGTRDGLHDRWQRIAASAAAQSGRAVVPEIAAPLRFDNLITGAPRPLLLCAEPALGLQADEVPARPDRATLLVGPEGGWAREEADAARREGAVVLTLGARRLRAELAPVVTIASLWTRWSV